MITKEDLEKNGLCDIDDWGKGYDKLKGKINFRDLDHDSCYTCKHVDFGYEGESDCQIHFIQWVDLDESNEEGITEVEGLHLHDEAIITYYNSICDSWKARK